MSPSRLSGPLSLSKGLGENDISKAGGASVDIIDIRRKAVELNLKEDISSQFHPKTGPRTLPTLLLYSERGLQLFEDVSSAQQSASRTWMNVDIGTDHVSGRVLFDK